MRCLDAGMGAGLGDVAGEDGLAGGDREDEGDGAGLAGLGDDDAGDGAAGAAHGADHAGAEPLGVAAGEDDQVGVGAGADLGDLGAGEAAPGWRRCGSSSGGRGDHSAFLVGVVCCLKVRVGANSPSLCPTMFSVT